MKYNERERAILVGLQLQDMDDESFRTSFRELANLAETAGAEVVAELTQKRVSPDRATYIGKGKVEELTRAVQVMAPDLIIVNGELSPIQQRNLENILDIKILDRTSLILDIFALRARSREGILQVELARLQYKLPRLTGKGQELSRQGGGIGTRGAGEQKLELDRRHIRRRIREIERQLEDVKRTRQLHREKRRKRGIPTVSLVGYTNAGKSTLFNTLFTYLNQIAEEQVEAENLLFKTLDTTTRKVTMRNGRELLIADTVGFIQNLPHHLINAFRSTLEEVLQADLLLHIVDASSPHKEEQMKTAEAVLRELGALDRPVLTIYNKADLIDVPPFLEVDDLLVSAKTGSGIEELAQKIEEKVFNDLKVYHLLIPYSQGLIMSQLHRFGEILQKEEEDHGWEVRVSLSSKDYGRIRQHLQPLLLSDN